MDRINVTNIAIIGLGEIGSRHLQALTNIALPCKIYGVEPSKLALNIAKSRLEELSANQLPEIQFFHSVEELPKQLGLVIIATSSDIRLKILESLFDNNIEVENIIFEKVVFQRSEDFEKANRLLSNNQTASWVNCPRRSWPIYQELRSLLKKRDELNFVLKGGDWGMGCNSIHFIDLIEWLTASKIFEISIDKLDPVIFESKRKGFMEFSGKLKVNYTGKNKLHLISDVKIKQTPEIKITGKDFKICINESKGTLLIEKENESNSQEFKTPYQSEMSNFIAEDILIRKKANLPGFDESMRQHIIMLNALQDHIQNTTLTKIDYCPIT